MDRSSRSRCFAANDATGALFDVAPTGGTVWSAAADLRFPPTAPTGVQGRIALEFRSASASLALYTATIANTVTAGTTVSITNKTAPTGTTLVRIYIQELATATATAATVDLRVTDVILEKAATVGDYFDGDFAGNTGRVYAWSGPAYGSTSTETTYVPAFTVTTKTDEPCPRAELVVTDLTPTDNVVTFWRTSEGYREPIRGTYRKTVNSGEVVVDYEMPFNRDVIYEIEIVSGASAGLVISTVTANLPMDRWWMQDPLVPASAMAVASATDDPSVPIFTSEALAKLQYTSGVSILPVPGSDLPVAIAGQRMAAAGIPFNMFTQMAESTTALRNLLKQTAIVLLRPGSGPGSYDGFSGAMYLAVGEASEVATVDQDGVDITEWQLSGQRVAAPTLAVVVPIWTYGEVEALWSTYQQAQTTLAAKTYLDTVRSPSGA